MASLHEIYREASRTMDALRDILRGRVDDKRTAASDVIESIRLLVALREPRETLRSRFLGWQRARLAAILDQCAAPGSAAPGEDVVACVAARVLRSPRARPLRDHPVRAQVRGARERALPEPVRARVRHVRGAVRGLLRRRGRRG